LRRTGGRAWTVAGYREEVPARMASIDRASSSG
jgi:hypothetical protein